MDWLEIWAMMEVIGGCIGIGLFVFYIIYTIVERLKTKKRMKKKCN